MPRGRSALPGLLLVRDPRRRGARSPPTRRPRHPAAAARSGEVEPPDGGAVAPGAPPRPGPGACPRPGTPEGTSGLVGSALGIARAQVGRGPPSRAPRLAPGRWAGALRAGRRGRPGDPGLALGAHPPDRRPGHRPAAGGATVAGPADVVQAYTDPHLLLAPRARARVLHFQTPVPASPTGFYGHLAGRADLIVCCSDFIGRQVRSRLDFRPDRVAVVHNGVDLARFAGGGRGRPRGLAPAVADRPGRVRPALRGGGRPQKGLLHLLHALARLHPARPCRLLVAGGAGLWPTADEPYPKETGGYAGAVREAGEALPVTWLGVVPQEEMPGLYALADLFVCPSEWDEPFGTVNVEAMAAGTPVVASRVGGIPEAVTDGETGLLVPPADPPALAAALGALIDDAGRRHRMAAARARAGRLHLGAGRRAAGRAVPGGARVESPRRALLLDAVLLLLVFAAYRAVLAAAGGPVRNPLLGRVRLPAHGRAASTRRGGSCARRRPRRWPSSHLLGCPVRSSGRHVRGHPAPFGAGPGLRRRGRPGRLAARARSGALGGG